MLDIEVGVNMAGLQSSVSPIILLAELYASRVDIGLSSFEYINVFAIDFKVF